MRWCSECYNQLVFLTPPLCLRCGQKIQTGDLCGRCKVAPPNCQAIRSLAEFSGPLRDALHTFKYQRNIGLGDTFSALLLPYLERLAWPIDLIAPVPLGTRRRQERGYNQAALLAKPLALGSGLPYNPQTLWRVRETPTQVGLSVSERQRNVSDAFEASVRHVNDKAVLLIDDVMTSGATVNACAEALLKAGACEVFGLTLARAPLSAA